MLAIKRTLLQTEEEEDDEEEKEVTAMIGKQRTMYGIITLYLLSVGRLIHSLSVELPYNILWQEGNEQSKGGGDVQGVERGGHGYVRAWLWIF